jgi:hypothetical protein
MMMMMMSIRKQKPQHHHHHVTQSSHSINAIKNHSNRQQADPPACTLCC